MSDIDYKLDVVSKKYEQGLRGWQPFAGGLKSAAAGDATYLDASALLAKWKDQPRVDTFLYREVQAMYDAIKHPWEVRWQNYGTCVGQGITECTLGLMARRVNEGIDVWQGEPCVAGTYAGGRVNIANQAGRWEGSNGNWSIKFLQKYGVLLRKHVGLSDDGTDAETKDEELAIKWTNSRQGVPVDMLAKAAPFKVAFWTYLDGEPEDVGLFLQNGFYVTHGSSYWVNPGMTGDDNGICRAVSQRGGHQQCWMGVRWDGSGHLMAALDRNSWGASYGKTVKRRYPDDQPPGTVWEDRESVRARMKSGEVIAFAGPGGFESAKIDYHLLRKK